MAKFNWEEVGRLLEEHTVSTEEHTPLDQDASNKVIIEKLNAVLSQVAILSREVSRHSKWLGLAALAVRWGAPFVALMLARAETLPPWLRHLIGSLVGGGSISP
jgi:hypothetical protein